MTGAPPMTPDFGGMLPGAPVIGCTVLLCGLVVLFWWEIRQGIIWRCLDVVEWIINKLHWCVRKDAELRAKLKELEEQDKE